MSANEMNTKVKDLRELRRMREELDAEITAIEDLIKADMLSIGADTLTGCDWKITWKPVMSNRFDSTAFKKTHAELYSQYTRQTETRRFLVA